MLFNAIPLSVALAVLPFLTATTAQSSSSSSPTAESQSSQSQLTSSASPSSSGTPSGGGGGGGGAGGLFSLQECLTFLNSSGYTALSSAIQQANHTESGQKWLAELSDGNWTVFAPTNQALSSVPQNVSGDPSVLSNYLSYHFIHGDLHNTSSSQSGAGGGGGSSTGPSSSSPASLSDISESATASASAFGLFNWFSRRQGNGQNGDLQLLSGIYPNDTIGRTALNSSDYVQLEGDKAQVLAWTRFNTDGNVTILNQMTSDNQNLTVSNGTQWRNLAIFEVNGVFLPPGNISTVLDAAGDQPFDSVASQVQVSGANGSNISVVQAFEQARGFTLFAPSTEAFTSEFNATLQGLQQNNPSQVLGLLENHYINGSTVYSPTLREAAFNRSTGNDNTHFTSAGGQYFSFSSNDTGLFVSVGNDTSAQITRPDILVENGVIHLIDRVLFQTDQNAEEASSAFSSASQQATDTSTDTAAIIFPAPTTSGGAAGGESTSSSMESSTESSFSSSTEPAQFSTVSNFRIRRALHD